MKKLILIALFLMVPKIGHAVRMGCDTISLEVSYVYSLKCPKERPLMEISLEDFCGSIRNKKETGKCVDCNYPDSIKILKGHEKDFDICPNRKIQESYGKTYSVLKECPANTFRSYYPSYSCVSCNNEYPQSATQEECSKCSNRTFDRETCFFKKGK